MSAYARTPEHGVFTPVAPCEDTNDHRIVRLLKNRIEVLTIEIDMLTEKFKTCDTDETLKLIDLRNELQKILDGEK